MTHRSAPLVSFGAAVSAGTRLLADEVPVALSYNGSTQAVMMATPADLADFARGFTITEGFAKADEIDEITIVETPKGIDAQIWLTDAQAGRLAARRRAMIGPVGCGLCGIDSLEQAARPVPSVTAGLEVSPDDIMAAMAALPRHQALHDRTRAVHAAGLFRPGEGPGEGLVAVREDVGRHNALDKLAGACAGQPPGIVVMTSRLSVDLVQKVAVWGMPVLVGASAPTAAAVALAMQAGITLIGQARPDRFDLYAHPERLTPRATAHVA
jgi:FdhD protein